MEQSYLRLLNGLAQRTPQAGRLEALQSQLFIDSRRYLI